MILRAPRPSRLKNMEASVSRFWCRKGYTGITIFGHIFTRTQEDADKFNSKFDALKNHEMIHVRQAQSLYDSWFLFYVRYLWFSLMAVGYVRRMKGAMYYLNPFEIEAYRYMWERDYLERCSEGAVGWREYAHMSLAARMRYVKKYNIAH